MQGQSRCLSCIVEGELAASSLNVCTYISLGNFDYLCEHVLTWIYSSTFNPLSVKDVVVFG